MEQDTYVLNEDERGYLEDVNIQIQTLQAEGQTILRAIARRHKLEGNWSFDPGTWTFTKGT